MNQQLYIVRRNSGQGGAERVAARLADSFSDQFDVHRLWAGEQFAQQKIPGDVGMIAWRRWQYARYISQLPIYNPNSVVYSLEKGPICDIYRAGDGVQALNIKSKYGKRKSWMLNPAHLIMPSLERKSFESARYIIANSEMVRGQILSVYPHVEDKIVTIYNGYDQQLFKLAEQDKTTLRKKLDLPVDADKILLLSGSGFERKGLHHAINIVKALHEQACKAYLVVAGKGDSTYVREQIKQAGLDDFILFKGVAKNIAEYYQAADMMVLLTRNDPFANVCLEAWACGCPVITTTHNGAAEIMQYFSGFVVTDMQANEMLAECAGFILQHQANPAEIAASVKFLTADKEKSAHLAIINQVFATKERDGE